MTERLTRQLLADTAIVHETLPGLHQTDRTFELPTRLYAAMAALFFGCLAVMTIGFANPEMVLPMAINVIFVAMFFAVPALWTRMKPDHTDRATTWARFQRDGVMTPFGRVTARDATLQMLILPAIVFGWAIAVVTIVALVR
jgi:hypothetical protein